MFTNGLTSLLIRRIHTRRRLRSGHGDRLFFDTLDSSRLRSNGEDS
jgi:hypothetical protein